jgi:uncharacterized repeat protein (TIGR01451 family)
VLTWTTDVPAATAAGPGSAVFTYAVTVDQTATPGSTLANNAVAGSLSAGTTHTVATGDLTLVKAVDKDTAEYGDTLHYTFTAAATGNADQTNVKVTDVVPDGTSYVDGSAGCTDAGTCTTSYDDATRTLTWQIGDLAAGASRALEFDVTIDTPDYDPEVGLPVLTIRNTGQISSDLVDPATSNQVRTDVIAVLGITVEKPQKPAVKPEHEQLPFTGAIVGPGAIRFGGGLVLVGLLLTVTARRRRA